MTRLRSRVAPTLGRLLAHDPDPTALYLPAGRSVRGIDTAPRLDRLDLPAGVDLRPVARLPRLRELHLTGPGDSHPVHLGPLSSAPALEALHVHGGRVIGLEALVAVRTLRVVELSFLRCPDLRPLRRLPLHRLVLDGVRGVRLGQLRGLSVEQLDLWGCTCFPLDRSGLGLALDRSGLGFPFDDRSGPCSGLADPALAVLASMPNLREVWLHLDRGSHPGPRSLAPLVNVRDGARIVLDGQFDPERDRDRLAALEARGVWIWAGDEPHENGVHPSWWGPCPGLEQAERAPPTYTTRR
ncbi:MAG: hypothetical protein ABMB14_31555 [Myxococcota bacterium]